MKMGFVRAVSGVMGMVAGLFRRRALPPANVAASKADHLPAVEADAFAPVRVPSMREFGGWLGWTRAGVAWRRRRRAACRKGACHAAR